MPYRHAHWYLLGLFPIAGLAFWPNYLSQLSTAPVEFHLHGVTASLWLALLVAQSWTIHHRHRAQHRVLGMASLVLFPLFMMGGTTIFIGMARRFAEQASPFHVMFSARLAWLDVVSVAGFAYLYFEALRQRGKVQLHSRYMLATVIFLLPPMLGRLAGALPPLTPSGPEEFWKLGIGFQLANAVTAAIAFVLAMRSGKHSRPFALAGWLTVAGALLFQLVGGTAVWTSHYASLATLPLAPLAASAGLAGVAIAYFGWTKGRRNAVPATILPTP